MNDIFHNKSKIIIDSLEFGENIGYYLATINVLFPMRIIYIFLEVFIYNLDK